MQQYKDLLQRTLDQGIRKPNRTGEDTFGIIGAHMAFDLSQGFPIVTLKKTYWKQAVSEMLCFLRGYSNAGDFNHMGCTVWNQNADENLSWLNNPFRKGGGDLGRIYGVQARDWVSPYSVKHVDQLHQVYTDLCLGKDNRREIVTHWNPAELDQMALPPCHLLYQFSIQADTLCLTMYQRSADMALGVPFNIVGYSWLLSVMAQITGLKVGTFNHFLVDVHIYANHLEGVKTMLQREPMALPTLRINPDIKTLEDLETWVTIDDFEIHDYQSHPAIKLPMAV